MALCIHWISIGRWASNRQMCSERQIFGHPIQKFNRSHPRACTRLCTSLDHKQGRLTCSLQIAYTCSLQLVYTCSIQLVFTCSLHLAFTCSLQLVNTCSLQLVYTCSLQLAYMTRSFRPDFSWRDLERSGLQESMQAIRSS